MATTRTRWSFRTFFTHIGQAVYQPETSYFQPTSEQGANKSPKDSGLVVAASLRSPSDKVPTQPTTIASSSSQPGYSIAAIPDHRSDPHVDNASPGPPKLNHDDSQAASSEEVSNTETRESNGQLGTCDAPTTRASGEGDQASPTPKDPSIKPKSYLDLPLELRQQILSYVVDPEDSSVSHAALTLTHRSATTLSHVSHQVRMDMKYVHFQWRQKHKIRDVMTCPIWTDDDQQMLDELSEMIGYHKDINRTRAQLDFVGAYQISRLLQTLNTFRAQKMETKNMIDQLKTTIGMQREINQELREENEKLVLALEMRDMGLGLEDD